MRDNGSGEDQSQRWNESLQRHKVSILKYLCLSLPLFITTSGELSVLVPLNREFSARPPRKVENTVGFLSVNIVPLKRALET